MTARASIARPAFAMVLRLKLPVAKVIALGGVDVGRTNAREHAIAVGITNSSGFSPAPTAILAMIGTRIDAAAEFDTVRS